MRILMYIWILLPLSLLGQRTAEFETTLHFEDALGNRDSVVVGYDKDATIGYDPEFGEKPMNGPWDSLFEARAAIQRGFSKKAISTHLNTAEVYVYTRNFPLTVRWESAQFAAKAMEEDEMRSSTIHRTWIPSIVDNWGSSFYKEGVDYACMTEVDSLTTPYYYRDHEAGAKYRYYWIEGIGLDSIGSLKVYFSQYGSPCFPEGISTKDEEVSKFSVSPNPTSGMVTILGEGVARWELYDHTLRQVLKGKTTTLDLSSLNSGMYIVTLYDDRGTILRSQKVVRIE